MGLELQYIKTFYIVGMTKSFTKAAHMLHLTQPAISHQIKMLEDNLNMKLFERSKKSLVLTEVGKQLLKRTRSILDLVERVEMEVEGFQTNVKGAIKIACPYELGTHWLVPRVSQFSLKYPETSFDIQLCHPNEISDLLFNYDVDVAIGLVQMNGNDVQSNVIFEETLVLACGKNNPLAKEKYVPLEKLLAHKFLIYEAEDNNLFSWLRIHKLKTVVDVALICNSYQAVKTWLMQGIGIAVVPYQSVEKEIAEGKIVELIPKGYENTKVINNVYMSCFSDTFKILKFKTFHNFIKDTKS